MAFTEFYVQTTGSNLNAGSTTGDNAVYTGVGDSDGTSVFTPSDGSTPASTVSAGDFGSVYVTAGATVAVFIGRITTVAAGVNGAITFSTTAKSGTFPAASAGAHTITCKTGGAWKGPNGAVNFPFGFITSAPTDSSGDVVRVNFKTGVTYSVTAAISHNIAGPIRFEGYTSTTGDGGRSVVVATMTGAGYNILSFGSSASNILLASFDVSADGGASSGSQVGIEFAGTGCIARSCAVHNMRGIGFHTTGNPSNTTFIECEAYACVVANGANRGGFAFDGSGTGTILVRCISHDHTTANGNGFYLNNTSPFVMINCVADTCTGTGFYLHSTTGQSHLSGCDAYNNGADGVKIDSASGTAVVTIENSNFIKNTAYGINGAGGGNRLGSIRNCGFGTGTQANTTADTNSLGGIEAVGSISYASGVTPWVDPANGDFRINLAAAKNAGRGSFTETAASYAGTVGYPDIGAAQHLDAGGGLLINPGMSGGLR